MGGGRKEEGEGRREEGEGRGEEGEGRGEEGEGRREEGERKGRGGGRGVGRKGAERRGVEEMEEDYTLPLLPNKPFSKTSYLQSPLTSPDVSATVMKMTVFSVLRGLSNC